MFFSTPPRKIYKVYGSSQLAAVGSNYSGAVLFPSLGENPYNTIVNNALENGRYVYTADSIYGDMDCNTSYDRPQAIYIGKEYKEQIVSTKITNYHNNDKGNILFKQSMKDEAHFEFICSSKITDLDSELDVTVTHNSTDITNKFTIKKIADENKRIFKVSLTLKEDLNYNTYSDGLNVRVALNGTDVSTMVDLEVLPINYALDFTLDESDTTRWDFFGEFLGTNTACKATPDDDGDSVWAWYPNGAEGYTGNVLVLNNLIFETIADNAMSVPAGTTIVVYGSQNKIQSKLTALISEGDVTIVGYSNIADESCFAMYSDNAGRYYGSQKCTYGAGLYAKNNGEVTIKNCWLRVDAGDVWGDSGTYSCNNASENNCYGISGGYVTFINAKANITAGKAYYGNNFNPNSAAVHARNCIAIKGNCELTLKSYNYALQVVNGNIEIGDTLRTVTNAYKDESRTTAITKDYNYLESALDVFYTKTADSNTDKTEIVTTATEPTVKIYIDDEQPLTRLVTKYTDFTWNFKAPTGFYISSIMYGIGEANVDALRNASNEISNTVYNGKNLTKATLTIKNVQNDYVVKVTYDVIVPSVTITNTDGNLGSTATLNASTNEYIDVEPNFECKYNEQLKLRLTAKDGYYIKTLIVDGVSLITNGAQNTDADTSEIEAYLMGFDPHIEGNKGLVVTADVSYNGITRDSNITVECAELTKYNVTVNNPTNGTVTFDPDISNGVAAGTTVTATATPDSGYELGTVTVNGSTVTPNANGEFSFTVTKNTTVEVTFDKKQNSGGGSSHIINGTDQLPTLDGTGYNYNRMAEVLTTYEAGSTATIEVNGNYNIPDEVIKAIADGKLKVTIVMDSTTSRYVDGADIQTVKSVDAEARRTYALDTDELSGDEAMQLILFNFDVPSDLIVTLKEKNAGLFANLYKYTNGEFEFADCAIITKDGKAVFEDYITNGTYAVMLSEYSGLLGDMNNDGKLTAADAAAVLRYVVGLEDERRNISVADFDGNGKINARDASMILKRVVGLI